MNELNSTDGKVGFIVSAVFAGVVLILAIWSGFSNGWGDAQTLFAFCATLGLGAWTAWKYICWKREN